MQRLVLRGFFSQYFWWSSSGVCSTPYNDGPWALPWDQLLLFSLFRHKNRLRMLLFSCTCSILRDLCRVSQFPGQLLGREGSAKVLFLVLVQAQVLALFPFLLRHVVPGCCFCLAYPLLFQYSSWCLAAFSWPVAALESRFHCLCWSCRCHNLSAVVCFFVGILIWMVPGVLPVFSVAYEEVRNVVGPKVSAA